MHIDTAVTTASVCLSNNNDVLGVLKNTAQKDHAAWLHTAIQQVVTGAAVSLPQLNAVAISAGPGSYTGLRVGMAAAKGLCYALNKPLISVNTLQIMAAAAKAQSAGLLCPMIDARRMEVFTAVYNQQLQPVVAPTNLILDENAFLDLLHQHPVAFFGNGSTKFKTLVNHPNAFFINCEATAANMVPLALECYKKQQFANLAYTEPFYGKAFHLPIVKPPI